MFYITKNSEGIDRSLTRSIVIMIIVAAFAVFFSGSILAEESIQKKDMPVFDKENHIAEDRKYSDQKENSLSEKNHAVDMNSYVREMEIKTVDGYRTFCVYDQQHLEGFGADEEELEEMKDSGCTACALTTIMNAFSPVKEYRNADPINLRYHMYDLAGTSGMDVYDLAEEMFDRAEISYETGDFPDDTPGCEKIIKKNMYDNYPMVVLLINLPREGTDVFKWTSALHCVVLLGHDRKGGIIVGDSMDRDWDGDEQRFKTVSINDIARFTGRDVWTKYFVIKGAKKGSEKTSKKHRK